jgi:hypothetical protein
MVSGITQSSSSVWESQGRKTRLKKKERALAVTFLHSGQHYRSRAARLFEVHSPQSLPHEEERQAPDAIPPPLGNHSSAQVGTSRLSRPPHGRRRVPGRHRGSNPARPRQPLDLLVRVNAFRRQLVPRAALLIAMKCAAIVANTTTSITGTNNGDSAFCASVAERMLAC